MLIALLAGCSSSSGSGVNAVTGGTTAASSSGGASSLGGTIAPGGSVSSGGSASNGGRTAAVGGTVGLGGAASGGAQTSATGGLPAGGGVFASGGTAAPGGASTVGDAGTGKGGSPQSTGGSTGTGGNVATGGSTPSDASTGRDSSDARIVVNDSAIPDDASTIPGCSAVPVTPNATAQARKVLCYLYSQYGNHMLSGQEEGGSDLEINYINTNTGKYPAIRAFEANGDGAATRCLTYWNAGGLCMFGYHMGAPGQADGYAGSQMKIAGEIDKVLTVGTNENTVFNQRLDAIANRLLMVQTGGGVVLFRPFHEAGGTWFWWSMEGGAQYVRLWKYAFDRVINTNGVRNALWLLPFDGSPQAAFYPGKDFVDIGGADNYNKAYDYSPMTSIFTAAKGIFGTTMPIALHECGPVPDPDLLQSSKTNWVFFSIWTQPYPEQYSTVAELQKVYSSSYVVSRDGVPSLK
jgi:beta-mannanase